MREMKLQDLKAKTPAELLAFAEEHQVENASTMKKADGVWLATGSEVARWCLDEVFKVDAGKVAQA